LIFVVVALAGELLAFLLYAANEASSHTTPISIVNVLRIGALYFFGFHHVTISFSGDVGSGANLFRGGVSFGVAAALLLVTAGAAYALYRAGRWMAQATGGTPAARALHGAKVAVPYALLSLLLSFVIPFDVPSGQPVRVGVAHGAAFVLPLLLGVVAGGLGGLLSDRAGLEAQGRWGIHGVTALVAGWRMFLYALGFAFASLLVLAAIHPDLTSDVVRGETSESGGHGVTMLNHVLALPNQSIFVLVPAMGGCDGVYGAGGPASVSFDALCYGHFPRPQGTTSIRAGGLPLPGTSGVPRLPFGFGGAPAVYYLFLLVPAVAVLLGGAEAGGRLLGAGRSDAVFSGALAGVVYGVLVGLGAWLAGVGVSVGVGIFGYRLGLHGTLGPRIWTATLLGLGWGVVGGAAGAAIRSRRAAVSRT
jgi:hypothetical protein